jgi:glycosyltransferase involved in cell wall biosynthesis
MANPVSWQLYSENEEAWQAMLSDCTNAQSRFDLEEFIFINDGSSDDSINILNKLANIDSSVKVIDFSRNFGTQLLQ